MMPERADSRDVQDGAGRNEPDDAPAGECARRPAGPACGLCAPWRAAVVLALVAGAGLILAARGQGGSAPLPSADAGSSVRSETPAPDNPLDGALATGRPVVADFGRGLCIPCKMMKPILDELKEQYAGRAEVLIIDIDEYPAVTQRVGIRAIPTQIFYDAQGREVHRHEGFMPREDIVAKLAEMRVK